MLKHSSPKKYSCRVTLSSHFQACSTLHPSQALQHEGLRANPPYKNHNPYGVAEFQASPSGNTPKPQRQQMKPQNVVRLMLPWKSLELQVSPRQTPAGACGGGGGSPHVVPLALGWSIFPTSFQLRQWPEVLLGVK